MQIAEIACRADLKANTVFCGAPGAGGASSDLIVGGQGVHVRLTSSNITTAADTFAFDVTVQNLVPQALGTSDGVVADPTGVRVLFASGPTTTAGSGDIEVANADGTGMFTASDQAYFQYSQLLATDETSSARRWKFRHDPTVTGFAFTLYVSAVVQYPNGWVSVGPDSLVLARGGTDGVSAVVRNAVGGVVSDEPVTFASSSAAATVSSTGEVTGSCGGVALITASTATRPARLATTVRVAAPGFASFSPDPYAAAGSFVARTADLSASFGYCSVAANAGTFVVRGAQGSPNLQGGSYVGTGTGTATYSHTGTFFPGEEVEVTLTGGLVSTPWVARLRAVAGAASAAYPGAQKTDHATGTSPFSVAIGDLNGDGLLDLAIANSGSSTVSVLLRNAANTGYDPKADYATGTSPFTVAIGDLNGDGRLDLAVANSGSNTVSVLLRNAANTGYEAKADYGTGSSPRSVTIGDLNGDGRLDLTVANYTANTVSVLLRSADNTGYDAKTDYATGTNPRFVAVGDLDGDGRQDLAVANNNSATVSVLLRNSANTGYDAKTDYVTGPSPISVAIGDLNGDGRPDLAVANLSAPTVSVLLRNAANTGYDAKTDYATATNPICVAIGDLNGDGRLDLAVANNSAGSMSVLLRSADNTGFDAKADHATGPNPRFVAIGDLTGDGRLDLAVVNSGSNTVSVLENTP